jgi:hypothetical protein
MVVLSAHLAAPRYTVQYHTNAATQYGISKLLKL